MAIPIKCAGCQAAFDVPDNLAGKTIRCTSCKAEVKVAAASAPAKTAPAAAKPAKKIEVDGDTKTKPGKSKDAAETKTKAKSAAARRRDDDDDDDDEDEDDRPRKKKGKAAAKGGGGMIALIAIGGIGICAIIAVSIFLFMGGDDEKKSASNSSSNTPSTGSPQPGSGGSQGPAAGSGIPSGWVETQEEEFSFAMPAKPQKMSQGDATVYMHQLAGGKGIVMVVARDMPAELQKLDDRKALQAALSQPSLSAGKITSRKETTHQGYPAEDMQVSTQGKTLTGRAICANGLFLLVAYGHDNPSQFASDANAFMNSVKFKSNGSSTGGGVAVGGPNAPGGLNPGGSSLGPTPGGSSLGPTVGGGLNPGTGSLPLPGGTGVGPLPGGTGVGPAPGGTVGPLPGGSSLGPTPGNPGVGSLAPPGGGAGPLPGGSSLGPLPGGSSLGPLPGGMNPMNPGVGANPGAGAGPGAAPSLPPPPPGGGGNSLGPVPGGPGPAGGSSLGPAPGGGVGLGPNGNQGGQSGGQGQGQGQDRPPAGAATRPALAHKIYAFYASAFDSKNNELYTITWRQDPKNQSRVLGELRRHSYPDFKEKAVFNIPNLATRAVIDPERGLLYAAAATNSREFGTLYSLGFDRANAYGDLQVYDLKPIQDGKVQDASDVKPIASINLNASIRGLELGNDGKHLFVAVNKAPPGGQPKTYIRHYEASDRKFIKEVSLGEQCLDVRKNADGSLLVGFEYDPAGRKPSTGVVTCDPVTLEVKKVRSPGVVTDYTTKGNGSAMFAVVGQADRNGARPGQLHAVDPAGDVSMLGSASWKASNNNYARFSPDGSHLFVSSFANRDSRGNLQNAGLDVYAPDSKEAGGYKKIASIRDAIRVLNSVPVGGYFDVTPDNNFVVFHTGAVLAVKNIAKNAEGADKVPEPGGNSGNGGVAGPGGAAGPGQGGIGLPGPGGALPGAGGVGPLPGGALPGAGGVGPLPGGALPGAGGVGPLPGGALPGAGGVGPLPGGALPGAGGVGPLPGGALPGAGGVGPLPGGGMPPAAPPKLPGM